MPALKYSKLDELIIGFDRNFISILSGSKAPWRPNPGQDQPEAALSEADRKQVIGFMRVNHAGEISAQALYQGQAITARDPVVASAMQESADEEYDHLRWCRDRIEALGGHTSYLDPFWYVGSFLIGTTAGFVGDRWSLGFIEETENQVVQHLQSHLDKLPVRDEKTRAILMQMQEDERHHGDKAAQAGARELPGPVKRIMRLCSMVMTKTAYYI